MQQPLGSGPQPTSHPQTPPAPPVPLVAVADAGGLIPRAATRSNLPHDSPARLVLPNRQTVFVTLHDVSRAGCCVMRKGTLPVQPDDKVTIEFWRVNIENKESLKATVRWVRLFDGKTRAGLRFLDTSVKTQRAVEAYLKQSLIPGA